MVKNLKIKAKLLLGFLAVSLLTVIVGIVGTVGLESTDAKYREMLDESTTAISSIADMREFYQMQRLMLRGIIIDIQDSEKTQEDIDQLKEYEAGMEKAMDVYENTISDPDEKQLYYSVKAAYTEYAEVKQKFINAARIGDYEMATEAFNESVKAAVPITEGLQETVTFTTAAVKRNSDEIRQNSVNNIAGQVVVMALAAVCAMGLGLYIASLISKPIKTLSNFFVRFGETGDLSRADEDEKNIAAHIGNRDEVGVCIAAAAKMMARITDLNEKLNQVAQGDLTVEVQALSEKDSLGLSVIKMVNSLNAMFSELRATSAQVSEGAGRISHGAQELAAGSSEQAASIEEFSSTLIGLQDKTRHNAENSIKAARFNSKMEAMLAESVSSMAKMTEAMTEIDESSQNITRVIKVIDDIAFQTNILALNAAVEAARAGLHGKGFAVVADEVRNLASKSADAAKETAALIEGSSAKVREGNQIVEQTNSSLQSVAESSKEVVRLIEEVSAASTEQAEKIDEMNHNIGEISNVVQENSASAEESAAASEEMSSQAVLLNNIVGRFKLKTSETHVKTVTEKKALAGIRQDYPKRGVESHDEKY